MRSSFLLLQQVTRRGVENSYSWSSLSVRNTSSSFLDGRSVRSITSIGSIGTGSIDIGSSRTSSRGLTTSKEHQQKHQQKHQQQQLPHDIGGLESAFGPIPVKVEELQAWEQQCHSLFAVLATKKIVSNDGLRSSIEALTPDQYKSWTYYEKWSAAMTTLLLEANVLTREEISNVLFGDLHSSLSSSMSSSSSSSQQVSKFQPGDAVRVKAYQAGVEWRRPHIRTPGYIYGVAGTIERVNDCFGDPSFLALGFDAPPSIRLYRVRFRLQDIWPEQIITTTNTNENSGTHDVVEVDLYEHWLEPSDQAEGHAFDTSLMTGLFDHTAGDDCVHHHHDHHHHHDSHDDHSHEPRPLVEKRAVDREGPPRPGKQLHSTLMTLLLEKGIVTANEIRLMSERMDTAGQRLDGASLVVEAWTDQDFQDRLLQDAPAAASELGIMTSNPNAPTILTVVPNTSTTHNLVVCTLCSCYPSGLLGIAPSWYKSSEYRSRAVREPRTVLQEFGTILPNENTTTIRVHDSTADHRYLVLPERPSGTEQYTKEELRSLITRDSMIGVSLPTIHS